MDKEAEEKIVANLLLSHLPMDAGSIGRILETVERVGWCDTMAKKIMDKVRKRFGYRKLPKEKPPFSVGCGGDS